jgi:rRNA maturation protein Nop10
MDHPFDETAKSAKEWCDRGQVIYQKFSCEQCGVRQTISVPNRFYTHGTCEECGFTTDIRKKGCNFMLVLGGVI